MSLCDGNKEGESFPEFAEINCFGMPLTRLRETAFHSGHSQGKSTYCLKQHFGLFSERVLYNRVAPSSGGVKPNRHESLHQLVRRS
jgi:hypothetical protein